MGGVNFRDFDHFELSLRAPFLIPQKDVLNMFLDCFDQKNTSRMFSDAFERIKLYFLREIARPCGT